MPAVDSIKEMQDNVEAIKSGTAILDKVNVDEPDEGDVTEYSETELKAMEKGWSPDKEALPEGKEWIGAGEFLRNERLYNEIHKLKREINGTKTTLDVLKEHHKKVEEATRAKVIAQLKQQKKIALEEDDHDAVIEIDEQLLDAKTATYDTPETTDYTSGQLFEEWLEVNTWYNKDEDMRQTADEIGAAYYQRSGGKASPKDMYDYVEKRIKKLYPNNFESKPAPRKAAQAVESASAGRTGSTSRAPKFTVKDLNAEQAKVMRTFVSQGVMTEQAYIEELIKIGELG